MGHAQAQDDGQGRSQARGQRLRPEESRDHGQPQGRSGKRQQKQRQQEEPPPSIAEWAAATIGFILVLGSLGVLGWEAISKDEGPPGIRFELQKIGQASGSFIVNFAAFNSGPQTAAGLHVSGTLKDGGKEVERSQVVLDYVPSQSSRQASLFFTRDPRGLQMELRAEGYRQP